MDIIENIVSFFKKPPEAIEGKAPEGLCPVCWGYQEYDKKIRKLYRDKQIDVNNHKDSYLLIQDFVIQHIDGISLKEGETILCPVCNGDNEEKKADEPR